MRKFPFLPLAIILVVILILVLLMVETPMEKDRKARREVNECLSGLITYLLSNSIANEVLPKVGAKNQQIPKEIKNSVLCLEKHGITVEVNENYLDYNISNVPDDAVVYWLVRNGRKVPFIKGSIRVSSTLFKDLHGN